MKPGTLTSKRLWIPVLGIGITVALASWDFKQTPDTNYKQEQSPTDTIPKKKKVISDKKVRDLDDVLDQLNAVDIDLEMSKAQEELTKALKEFDGDKIRLEIEKAMKDLDFSKINADIKESLKDIDMSKIQKEIQESLKDLKDIDMESIQKEMQTALAKVDFDKIKVELDAAKKIDMSKLQDEMKEMQKELEKIGPEIEKELANAKVEMGKAKVEIEKAKAEMKEYKEFVDGLDKDGLINKKDNYTISHKDGTLTVNGKQVSAQVYAKYRSFLEKHGKFSINKTADDFDMDMD